LYNCTGEAIISDQFDEYAIPLKISQNSTDISSENIYKGSEVIVTGDCCFVIFSQTRGKGSEQWISAGETSLELTQIKSAFIVDCPRPWWKHPLLHFFIFSVIIVGILYYSYTKGKELLFRRRV